MRGTGCLTTIFNIWSPELFVPKVREGILQAPKTRNVQFIKLKNGAFVAQKLVGTWPFFHIYFFPASEKDLSGQSTETFAADPLFDSFKKQHLISRLHF